MTAVDAATGAFLELDDIQAGALYERPSPYVGTYVLLKLEDRADGRELVRRAHRGWCGGASGPPTPPQAQTPQARPRSRSLSPTPGWRQWACRRRRWTA